MRELVQLLPVLVILLVFGSIVRNVLKLVKRQDQPRSLVTGRTAAEPDPAQAERTRRIQEEIRRKIAARRGVTLPPEPPIVQAWSEPPVMVEADSGESATQNAILVRQHRLADQMRALDVARSTEQHRAAQIAATVQTESQSERAKLVTARGNLLADLRDPEGLRRALVLREVLGPPVGLR
ncbi:MAG: hypothetical protein ABI222_14295 [Opitutaceae bacterium]